MDAALAIFNVGAGLGVLAAGLSLGYLAWRMGPLLAETRALARDLRRLARTTDAELRPLLERARELTTSAEVLSEDAAVKLDRIGELLTGLQAGLDRGQLTIAPGRREGWSVESAETREDASDA